MIWDHGVAGSNPVFPTMKETDQEMESWNEYWNAVSSADDEFRRVTEGIVGKKFLAIKGEHEGEIYKVTDAKFHPYVGGYVYIENTKTQEKHYLTSKSFHKYFAEI